MGRIGLAAGLLVLAGCRDARKTEPDVVASIAAPGGPLELDRRVVEDIAAREQVSEAEARERALDQLRFVAARRAELDERETPPEHPDDLDSGRREQLERAAMVRLWLHEVFEPAHTPADIPRRVIEQNMADPSLTRRLFHPEVWLVCQVLIVPSELDEDGRSVRPLAEDKLAEDPEAAERWRADASEAFTPMVERVAAVSEDLLTTRDCSVLGRIVGASKRSFDSPSGELTIRFENFAFAPSDATTFDPAWVETVTARAEPHLVGPFATQFGLHLVMVSEIQPAVLANGSLPPDQLLAAREQLLRGEIAEAWQADQLQRTLAEARDRRVVRLAAEIE